MTALLAWLALTMTVWLLYGHSGQGNPNNWTHLTLSFFTYQWFDRLLLIDLALIILSFVFIHSSYLISFSIPWLFTLSYCYYLVLPFPYLQSQYTFLLQLGLWSRQCLRLSLRGTPLSCTATWLVIQLQRSSGGMLRSTELTPSSSYGTELASVGYPSTQRTAPMASVCSASRASHWRTLGPMSAGPATIPGAMTSDKTLPSPGSAPRPPFQSYRVSGLCPVVPRWWNYIPLSQLLQPVTTS